MPLVNITEIFAHWFEVKNVRVTYSNGSMNLALVVLIWKRTIEVTAPGSAGVHCMLIGEPKLKILSVI